MQLTPVALYERGYTPLVSVVPPNATLSPNSKLVAHSLGKVPGKRLSNGTWAGYPWQTAPAPTLEDVRGWALAGANIGIKANEFPGVDIDVTDPALARMIEAAATAILGAAPVRVGRPPKRLLMYRTAEPFTRMRLLISKHGEQHMIELLGEGQQYLIFGMHPATGRAYEWDTDLAALPPENLTLITRAHVEEFFAAVSSMVEPLGFETVREGSGRRRATSATTPQSTHVAPSLEALRECVAAIPNTDAQFPTREDYIKVGYAIHAACGEALEEGFELFAEWAARWEGGINDPETVLQDWRRMRGPFLVGWDWLSSLARTNGWESAQAEFTADLEAPEEQEGDTPAVTRDAAAPIWGSEHWLAAEVVARYRGQLRYVNATRTWLVWDSARWVPDAMALAEQRIHAALIEIADRVARSGVSDEEKAANTKRAAGFLTAQRAKNVLSIIQSDPAIAVAPESLDADRWILNTPSGIVDLTTGELTSPDPARLCTKTTAAGPDSANEPTRWLEFLMEACAGDRALVEFLQRLAGYVLTGSTREQKFVFIHGAGGNGKSTFLDTILGVLGSYGAVAPMETFTASYGEQHTTAIAMLNGSRLVAANETQAGRRWDEAKVKSLTGGGPVTARFMRQDNFTFVPSFKLVFTGNHQPEVRDLDAAMKRRILMVEFNVKPRVVDPELATRLRAEWPQILAWMIRGCLLWQEQGLNAPAAVQVATDQYFEMQDAIGTFLAECTTRDPKGEVEVMQLFERWRGWAAERNEYVGTIKRFSQVLGAKNFARKQAPGTRRAMVTGLTLNAELGGFA